MYSKFGQFIDGKWQPSANKETYDVINPATEEIIGQASKASPTDVDRALLSAKKGFEVWKKVKPWERSKIIRKVADEIRKRSKVFAKWMTLETGKTLAEGEAETVAAAAVSASPSASVFPVSKVINLAKTSLFFLISSAIFLIIFDRSHGLVFFQTSNPFSADFKALSTSAGDALEAFPIISSVAGFITS